MRQPWRAARYILAAGCSYFVADEVLSATNAAWRILHL
jgi:hypothetical protein